MSFDIMPRQAARDFMRNHFECFVNEKRLKSLTAQVAVAGVKLHNALPHQETAEIFAIPLEIEDAVEFVKYLNQANPHPFIVYERNPLQDKFKKDFAGQTIYLQYLIEGVNGWISFPDKPKTKITFTPQGLVREAVLSD